jgi:hypothetical protein
MIVVDDTVETLSRSRASPDDVTVRLGSAGLLVSAGLAACALTHTPGLRRATWGTGASEPRQVAGLGVELPGARLDNSAVSEFTVRRRPACVTSAEYRDMEN